MPVAEARSLFMKSAFPAIRAAALVALLGSGIPAPSLATPVIYAFTADVTSLTDDLGLVDVATTSISGTFVFDDDASQYPVSSSDGVSCIGNSQCTFDVNDSVHLDRIGWSVDVGGISFADTDLPGLPGGNNDSLFVSDLQTGILNGTDSLTLHGTRSDSVGIGSTTQGFTVFLDDASRTAFDNEPLPPLPLVLSDFSTATVTFQVQHINNVPEIQSMVLLADLTALTLVPEPSTALMVASGLLALGVVSRR